MDRRVLPAAVAFLIPAMTFAASDAAAQDEWFVAGFIALIFLVPVVVRIIPCWWIYHDAHRRGKSSALWIVLTLVSPLIGVILWYLERDKPVRAYYAYYYPPPGYAYLPPPGYGAGGFRAGVTCRSCGAQIPLGSLYCTVCGANQR